MKGIDDLKALTGHAKANASQKATDHAKEIVDLKELTGHVKANASQKVTDHVKGIDVLKVLIGHEKVDQWKAAALHSSACWIRTRTDGCRKMSSPKPQNCSTNWIAITTATWIRPNCLPGLAVLRDPGKEIHPVVIEVMLLVRMHRDAMEPLAVMRHEVTTHAATRHVVKPPQKGIALPVIDVLRLNEHEVIASPEPMPTVNVQQLPSSSVWIATETERSPRTKLQKR